MTLRKRTPPAAAAPAPAPAKAGPEAATPLRYEVTFKRPKKTFGNHDEGGEHYEEHNATTETEVREAIREARRRLTICLPGTQVTVRAFGPGRPPKRGRVEFQAHVNGKGKIIVEER